MARPWAQQLTVSVSIRIAGLANDHVRCLLSCTRLLFFLSEDIEIICFTVPVLFLLTFYRYTETPYIFELPSLYLPFFASCFHTFHIKKWYDTVRNRYSWKLTISSKQLTKLCSQSPDEGFTKFTHNQKKKRSLKPILNHNNSRTISSIIFSAQC